ncbi:hypothetical protein HDU79_010195 [Rhizoclosmatium sp. JEL0117]|nr:hypothetical protein HDU79_010195 [Rhizoclosmatium sp. JEL0117]
MSLTPGLVTMGNQVSSNLQQTNSIISSMAAPTIGNYQPATQSMSAPMNDLNPSEKWNKFLDGAREEDDDDDMSSQVGQPVNTQSSYFMNNDGFTQPTQPRSNGGSDIGTSSYGSVSFYQKAPSSQRAPPRMKYTSMPYSYDAPYSARLQESRQFFDEQQQMGPQAPQSSVNAGFAMLSVGDGIRKDNQQEFAMVQPPAQQQQQLPQMQQQPQMYQPQPQQQQSHQLQVPQQYFPQQQQSQLPQLAPPQGYRYEEEGGSALSMNSQASFHQYSQPSGGSPTMSSLSNQGGSSVTPGSKGHFICPEPGCGKVFDRAQKLKSHSVSHKADRPFICGYCNLAFQRNHDLTRHMRLHTNEKPHKCMQCTKSFMRADALKRHSKMDHGEI